MSPKTIQEATSPGPQDVSTETLGAPTRSDESLTLAFRVKGDGDMDGMTKKHSVTSTVIFWGIQASCLLVFFTGVDATALALCFGLYFLRMFGITGGYHRYFSHRTYRTSRAMQLALGVLGATAIQKGPLWWAGVHRLHHRHSDGPGDPHSPRLGFWHAHVGWIFEGEWDDTRLDQVRDLARYPELVWLNRYHFVPPLLLAVLCYAIGGFTGLVWGMAVSTTLLWHSTYTINSLMHRWGTPRYDTGDDSRNSLLLALLTMGEGWHNNHHYHQSCTRQGFYWWEIDITYYILRGMQSLGLVWDIKEPPARVYERESEAYLPRAA